MKVNFTGKKKNRLLIALPALYLFIAILSPILANDQPLFVSVNGEKYFPAFDSSPYIELTDENKSIYRQRKNSIDWKNFPADIIIFPPVCWSATQPDLLNTYSSPFSKQVFFQKGELKELPFRYRHFLGTGRTGNDLLSGLIHGTRTSVMIGLFSMIIAGLIGVSLGGIAGYFGDNRLQIRRGGLIIFLILILPAWYYSFQLRSGIIAHSFSINQLYGMMQIFFSMILFCLVSCWPFIINFKIHDSKMKIRKREWNNPPVDGSSLKLFENSDQSGIISWLNKKQNLPVDTFVSRFIEIFLSLPRLILILTVAAISKPSVVTIILIIGFTSWTEIARLMRAQVLSLREMNYITAARSYGLKPLKIISHHLLPNAVLPLIVVGIFGIASAILTEAGLSFLGIGVPPTTATWGSLMFEAKENFTAWWLVLFSGLAVFLLLTSLYIIADRINKKIAGS